MVPDGRKIKDDFDLELLKLVTFLFSSVLIPCGTNFFLNVFGILPNKVQDIVLRFYTLRVGISD